MKQPEIQITKSWRKSLSMRFDKHGVLQVKAPKFLLRPQIDAFISKNQAWIDREHYKISEREINKKYYLLGKELATSLLNSLSLEEREAASSSSPGGEELRGGLFLDSLKKYYKQEAKSYIVLRCKELAKEYGFTYKGIRITSAATRWGSCSSRKTLNFSYRLIMSPPESIDYVIIHELCHLRQMNHSAKFWKEVANIMPNYKQYETHLKKEGWKYQV